MIFTAHAYHRYHCISVSEIKDGLAENDDSIAIQLCFKEGWRHDAVPAFPVNGVNFIPQRKNSAFLSACCYAAPQQILLGL